MRKYRIVLIAKTNQPDLVYVRKRAVIDIMKNKKYLKLYLLFN
jgi:hypothetical protein